jgi:hypothetical protein
VVGHEFNHQQDEAVGVCVSIKRDFVEAGMDWQAFPSEYIWVVRRNHEGIATVHSFWAGTSVVLSISRCYFRLVGYNTAYSDSLASEV